LTIRVGARRALNASLRAADCGAVQGVSEG
jgi:hypothetical protein